MHGSKISNPNTNPEHIPDHDTVMALIIAGAAPGASAEDELAAAGSILGFEHKGGMWTRTCSSCRSTMLLMETENEGIVAIGIGFGKQTCSNVPRVNEWLRDMGFQNPARHRAAVNAMVRQHAGAGVSLDPSDRPDVNLLVRCALAFIPNTGAGVHYDIWFNIGAAIYSAQIEDGYEVFRQWSARSSKYKEKVCREKWDRHNGFRKITRVTVGTLIYHADKCDRDGWRNFYQQQLFNNGAAT